MNGRFLLLLGLVSGLVLSGLALLQGELVALAIPLIIYLGAAIYFSPEKPNLTAERVLSSNRVTQDAPVDVHLTITNQGPAIDELKINDLLPAGLEIIDGITSIACTLPKNTSVEIGYSIKGKRGEYAPNNLQAVAGEAFNLFTETANVQSMTRLTIRPKFTRLGAIKIDPPQTRGFSGPIPARMGGSGVNFFGVREYQPGDSMRQINWKIAARSYNDLFTTIFEKERVADVGIIVDGRHPSDIITKAGSLFEHSVFAAASISESFLREGNRVALLIYGSGIQSVLPGYGKMHHERILRSLARTNTGFNYALEHLSNLPTRLFPAGSQIVLISPLVHEDVNVLIQLRASGYAVMVISPNPVEYEHDPAQSAENNYAYRLASAERRFMLQTLYSVGIQAVDWHVDTPLDKVLQEMSTRQPVMRHIRGW